MVQEQAKMKTVQYPFKIESELPNLDEVTLDPESYCPQVAAKITVLLVTEGQHDGHLWSKHFLELKEQELAEEMAREMVPHLLRIIKEAKPYSCHC